MKQLIFCVIASVLSAWGVGAQISPGAYKAVEMHGDTTRNHLLLVSDDYIIHTTYDSEPAHFISTMGGVLRNRGRFAPGRPGIQYRF